MLEKKESNVSKSLEKTAPVNINSSSVSQSNINASSAGYKSVFTAPVSISLENPLSALRKCTEQMEAMSKDVAPRINSQANITAILKWVTEGHLEEVKKLLDENKNLAFATGTVTDRSDRTFKDITILQYAAWALDIEMCHVIIPYIDQENKMIQLNALTQKPAHYSDYGAGYDMTPLITKTQIYVSNYSKWKFVDGCKYWQNEVGTEQHKCPAWLIYAWSEKGEDVAWVKKDFSRGFKREYAKHHLEWWFTENYEARSKVRSKEPSLLGVARGTWGGRIGSPAGIDLSYGGKAMTDDVSCHQMLRTSRQEALENLRIDLKINNSLGLK